jgi:Cu+-exporting ATPase
MEHTATYRQEEDTNTIAAHCFHCGDPIEETIINYENHSFCCVGCQGVYQLLHQHRLQSYYQLNAHPGKTTGQKKSSLAYLDEMSIADSLIDYKDDHITKITFYVPSIHCSSCVWLLENLPRIDDSIASSRTDFLKKWVSITFRHQSLSLRNLVELMRSIGYEPTITLQDVVKESTQKSQTSLIAKIAVAGFCFGNSMMLSFPEYFGMGTYEAQYATFFGWLNVGFGVPVLLYSARGYFEAAYQSLKHRQLSLDVPLALGIAVLFLRTWWEVATGTGAGFADTLCGLVFFILIGKWVQQKTYYHLSFERDYRSYFPVAVTCLEDEEEKSVPISALKVGDRILIRNQEIVPADSILIKGHAAIDFAFVTGESQPVIKREGELIYAGGRQTQEAIQLEIVKPVSQSYLTRLWNQEESEMQRPAFMTFSHWISQYFTVILVSIALGSLIYWVLSGETGRGWAALTAVLIIACPCALALSSPFTLSAALSIFDKNHCYLKNTHVIEQMAAIDTLVFDKTGTLSSPQASSMRLEGELSSQHRKWIASLCRNSNHPLSRQVYSFLHVDGLIEVDQYEEIPGKGMRGKIEGEMIRMGSASWVGMIPKEESQEGSCVYIQIGSFPIIKFSMDQPWRPALKEVLQSFQPKYHLHLISGDQQRSTHYLRELFGDQAQLIFGQMPSDKLNFIRQQQAKGHQVCMIGDGLNDAGALKVAHFGLAISDDINNFSPGSDALLDGRSFRKLPTFFAFAKDARRVIRQSFAISLAYNVVGLTWAVQGSMSPLFAAILMPLSTVTIILFTSLATHKAARSRGLI